MRRGVPQGRACRHSNSLIRRTDTTRPGWPAAHSPIETFRRAGPLDLTSDRRLSSPTAHTALADPGSPAGHAALAAPDAAATRVAPADPNAAAVPGALMAPALPPLPASPLLPPWPRLPPLSLRQCGGIARCWALCLTWPPSSPCTRSVLRRTWLNQKHKSLARRRGSWLRSAHPEPRLRFRGDPTQARRRRRPARPARPTRAALPGVGTKKEKLWFAQAGPLAEE